MKITEHNVATGEVIERDATEEEVDQAAKDQAELNKRLETEAQKAIKKAALLAKLGISDDEAKLLLS
jgi:hypothetical protein